MHYDIKLYYFAATPIFNIHDYSHIHVWSRLGDAPRLYMSIIPHRVPFTIQVTARCFDMFIIWYVVVTHASF